VSGPDGAGAAGAWPRRGQGGRCAAPPGVSGVQPGQGGAAPAGRSGSRRPSDHLQHYPDAGAQKGLHSAPRPTTAHSMVQGASSNISSRTRIKPLVGSPPRSVLLLLLCRSLLLLHAQVLLLLCQSLLLHRSLLLLYAQVAPPPRAGRCSSPAGRCSTSACRSLLKVAVLVLHGGDGERRSPPI
jgi:hypothetical protein